MCSVACRRRTLYFPLRDLQIQNVMQAVHTARTAIKRRGQVPAALLRSRLGLGRSAPPPAGATPNADGSLRGAAGIGREASVAPNCDSLSGGCTK